MCEAVARERSQPTAWRESRCGATTTCDPRLGCGLRRPEQPTQRGRDPGTDVACSTHDSRAEGVVALGGRRSFGGPGRAPGFDRRSTGRVLFRTPAVETVRRPVASDVVAPWRSTIRLSEPSSLCSVTAIAFVQAGRTVRLAVIRPIRTVFGGTDPLEPATGGRCGRFFGVQVGVSSAREIFGRPVPEAATMFLGEPVVGTERLPAFVTGVVEPVRFLPTGVTRGHSRTRQSACTIRTGVVLQSSSNRTRSSPAPAVSRPVTVTSPMSPVLVTCVPAHAVRSIGSLAASARTSRRCW